MNATAQGGLQTRLLSLGLVLCLLPLAAQAGVEQLFGLPKNRGPLPVAEAFPFSAHFVAPNVVSARWNTRPGHYLYRDKLRFEIHGAGAVAEVCWPASEAKDDPYFGRLEVYQEPIEVRLLLDRTPSKELVLLAHYQGCAADAGICYPPAQVSAPLIPGSFAAAASPVASCSG